MKVTKYFILSLIFIFIFTSIVVAINIRGPLDKVPKDRIDIKTLKGVLEEITYCISSTRLNNKSTTTYRTSEIRVKLGNRTFVVGSEELEKIKPTKKQGTLYHMITITKDDIKEELKEQGATEEEIESIEETYFNNPKKIDVGAKIDIIQNGNSEPVASIEKKEDINDIAGHYHFTETHFKDMRSRFKPAEVPIISKEKEITPNTGLRPTSIRDESIREKGE